MNLRRALRRLTPAAWIVIGSGTCLAVLLLYAAFEGGGR